MRFEMPPHILYRIEFGRVSRQTFNHDAPLGGRHIVFDQHAAMNGCAIPDDQHFSAHVPFEMLEKLDDLDAFDAAGMNLKIKPPERQAADDRKAFPVERLVQHGGLPARRPSADSRRAGAQSAFIYENDGSFLLAGLFFKRAIPLAASDGWLSRLAPPHGALVSGN